MLQILQILQIIDCLFCVLTVPGCTWNLLSECLVYQPVTAPQSARCWYWIGKKCKWVVPTRNLKASLYRVLHSLLVMAVFQPGQFRGVLFPIFGGCACFWNGWIGIVSVDVAEDGHAAVFFFINEISVYGSWWREGARHLFKSLGELGACDEMPQGVVNGGLHDTTLLH